MPKKAIYSAIKWLFVIAAFLYLAYKLISFDKYAEFAEQWRTTPLTRYWWLAGVLVLLPLNWLVESVKWQLIVTNIQKLTLIQSLKGVLSGITTGFFTPNRIGDFIGRIMFLKNQNRVAGVTLSILNSLTQNLVIILCGIPACILLLFYSDDIYSGLPLYIGLCVGLLLALMALYFFLPALSVKIRNTKIGNKIKEFTECLADYSTADLIKILFVSLFRYGVFSTQFFFMLRFFDVQLTVSQAMLCIPVNYLFVTFTPSLAFSEAAVRTSYAMMFIGLFSEQTINIALAGVAIWVVNWVFPLLVGSVIVLKSKNN